MSLFSDVTRAVALSMLGRKSETDDFWFQAVGGETYAGVEVNEETALNYSAVFAATRVLSESIGSLPLMLMRRVGDKATRKATEHPLWRIIHDEPTPEQDSMSWRDQQSALQINWGNCYAEIVRGPGGRVEALWPIHPSRLPDGQIKREGSKVVYYVLNDEGPPTRLTANRVLHIPGVLSENGVTGKGIIKWGSESMGIAMATERHAGGFFKSGATPRVVLSHPASVDKDIQTQMREQWDEVYGGPNNTNKLVITEDGMELKTLMFDPEASQLLTSRQFSVTDIARWYRLPPHMLADLSRSTFSNIEAENLSFVIHSLMPWLTRWEKALNRQLLTQNEKKKYFFKFNVLGLLRGDSKARAEFYTSMFQLGAFSPNDILELEDRNPYKGGDVRMVPLNYQSVEFANEKPVEKAPPSGNSDEQSDGKDGKDAFGKEEQTSKDQTIRLLNNRLAEYEADNDSLSELLDAAEKTACHGNETQSDFVQMAVQGAVNKMLRKHATAARREAKKQMGGTGNFVEWNDSFAEGNRDLFIKELESSRSLAEGCGMELDVEGLVDSHLDVSRAMLLDASSQPRDEFLDAIETVIAEWSDEDPVSEHLSEGKELAHAN